MTRTDRRVLVLTLGGTISMTGSGGLDVTPTLTASDLLRDAQSPVQVHSRELRQVAGAHLSYADVLAVAAAAREATTAGYDGVVVVQGTDTLEEMAFALDLLLDDRITTVVTGAMRNASAPGADGAANLTDAIATSTDPGCRGMGVLVVLAGEIHAAGLVRKAHTTAPHAFASWPGPLGIVHERRPLVLLRPARRPRTPLPSPPDAADLPRVAMVTALLGADDDAIRRVPPTADAVVVEAFGGGHVAATWVEHLGEMAADRPVVLCSRTRAGAVLEATYGFAGSERDLLARGVIPAGPVDALKAVVALTLLLGARGGRPGAHAAVRDLFRTLP